MLTSSSIKLLLKICSNEGVLGQILSFQRQEEHPMIQIYLHLQLMGLRMLTNMISCLIMFYFLCISLISR